MKWNDDWRNELKLKDPCCMDRLAECRNKKSDVVVIASIMYKYNKNKGAEDCLIRTMEWIGDWNSQFEMIDTITKEDFEQMLKKILTDNK